MLLAVFCQQIAVLVRLILIELFLLGYAFVHTVLLTTDRLFANLAHMNVIIVLILGQTPLACLVLLYQTDFYLLEIVFVA